MHPSSQFSQPFETTDYDLAAYLIARAYTLVHVAVVDHTTVFLFPGEAAISAEAYYQGATIPAKSILHAARQLNSRKDLFDHCH